MGLYTRVDRDNELELLDHASSLLNAKLLAGEITGFQLLAMQTKLDTLRRRAAGKLLRTGDILQNIRRAKDNLTGARLTALDKRGEKLEPEDMVGRAMSLAKYNQSDQPSLEIVPASYGVELMGKGNYRLISDDGLVAAYYTRKRDKWVQLAGGRDRAGYLASLESAGV